MNLDTYYYIPEWKNTFIEILRIDLLIDYSYFIQIRCYPCIFFFLFLISGLLTPDGT